MRKQYILIIVCLLGSYTCFSQLQLAHQLKQIINDSSNRFTSFRASFKNLAGNDSMFVSTLKLEGTDSNFVLISNDKSVYIHDSYWADIASSLSDKKWQKAC